MDIKAIRAGLARRAPISGSVPDDGEPAFRQLASARFSPARPATLTRLVTRFQAPVNWVRQHPRHPCCIVGVLTVTDRAVPLDGLVTEISLGGALFRQASDFIFDRAGENITLRFAEREWRGEIANVRRRGYGIRLTSEVSQSEIDDILARFGLEMSSSDAG